jgi:hypothetical protein
MPMQIPTLSQKASAMLNEENKQKNADLIISLLSSIVFAFIMIFGILVLQFNSYTQPLIISYSLLMGFIGVSF